MNEKTQTEEKKSSGSNKVMLTLSDRLKERIDQRASEFGVPLTQYIVQLIVDDLKKPVSKE